MVEVYSVTWIWCVASENPSVPLRVFLVSILIAGVKTCIILIAKPEMIFFFSVFFNVTS